MTSSTDPLSPSELQQLRESASKPAELLPLAVVPATGLHPKEFLHLHSSWIEWPSNNEASPNFPLIRIPLEPQPCRRKKFVSKSTLKLISRDRPCESCREGDDIFHANSRSEENNVVSVVDEFAHDQMKWWFRRFDTVPWSTGLNSLNRLANESIERDCRVTLRGLRYTFAVRAAKMGINVETITNQMGQNVITQRLRDLLHKHGEHIDLKRSTVRDYLILLNNNKSMSISEIAKALGKSYEASLSFMNQLATEGLVQQVRESSGPKPALWTNKVPPDTELVCQYPRCDRTFNTFNGRGIHESSKHK